MKNPNIKSGKTIGSYCSKARKYIEVAKGYRFDDKVVNQRTYEIIRNSYSIACVFHFFRLWAESWFGLKEFVISITADWSLFVCLVHHKSREHHDEIEKCGFDCLFIRNLGLRKKCRVFERNIAFVKEMFERNVLFLKEISGLWKKCAVSERNVQVEGFSIEEFFRVGCEFLFAATRHAGTLSRNEIYTFIKSLDWNTRLGVIKGLVIFTFLFCAARVKELHELKAKDVQIRKG